MVDEPEPYASPRVVQLPDSDPTRAAFEQALRSLPMLLEYADISAQIRRANYEALLRAGFTEQQALDLCWR